MSTCPVTAVIKEVSNTLLDLKANRYLAIKIPLKNKAGKVVATALLDQEDAELAKHNWWSNGDGYAVGSLGLMHAVVMGETPEGKVIDHRNLNPADNRRGNLRFVTAGINVHNCNRRDKVHTTSKHTGVCRSQGFWHVVFKGKYVARYDREIDAAWHFNIKVYEEYGALGKYNMIKKPKGFVEKVRKEQAFKSRGVFYKHGKIAAQFYGDKQNFFLGYFESEDEASQAYEEFYEKWYAEKERKHMETEITRDEFGPFLMAGDTVIHVSECDWHMLTKHTWGMSQGHPTATVSTNPKILVLPMHRYLLGTKKGFGMNHIDNDNTNNTRENLEFVSCSVKSQKKTALSKSGYSGVWINASGNFAAEIRKDGKKYCLGAYKRAEIAAYAYDMAALEFYGPRAHINDVDEPDGLEWDPETRRLKKVA